MQGDKANPSQQPATGGAPITATGQAYEQARNAATGGQAAPQPQTQQSPVGSGLRDFMMRGRAPLSRESTGRVLGDLTKKMTDYREQNKETALKDVDLRLVAVPRGSYMTDQFSNQISLLIMIVTTTVNNKDISAYHTLLLASEMSPVAPIRNEQYGYNLEQAQPPRTAAALADNALARVCRQKVMEVVGPQATVFSADWETVPDGFQINDAQAIEDLFINALRACWSELLAKDPNFTYDSLSGAAGDTSNVVSVHFNQDQANPPIEILDQTHQPVRSEILVDFRSEQPRSNSRDLTTENTANVVEYGQVSAMASLVIDPAPARQQQWGVAATGPDTTQEYSGEVTITYVNMAAKVDIPNVLLMLTTVLPLMDYQTRPWLRNFLPKHLQQNGRGAQFRPRDLGALNYDYKYKANPADPVGPFNTNDENVFTSDQFNWLTSMMIHPAAALSIDIPEVGDVTWILRPLAEANDVPEARAAIIKAADAMTDGRFSQIFNATQSRMIMLPRVSRVLNGSFTGDDGKLHDLREVDMLYLLNRFGHEDPEIGRRWAATFNTSSDAELAQRAKLIEMAVGNPNYTGISTHRTFHPDFLQSLDRAIAETGLRPRIEMAREDARLLIRHSAGLAQSGALMSNYSPSMFTQAGGYPAAGAGYRGMAHTRNY